MYIDEYIHDVFYNEEVENLFVCDNFNLHRDEYGIYVNIEGMKYDDLTSAQIFAPFISLQKQPDLKESIYVQKYFLFEALDDDEGIEYQGYKYIRENEIAQPGRRQIVKDKFISNGYRVIICATRVINTTFMKYQIFISYYLDWYSCYEYVDAAEGLLPYDDIALQVINDLNIYDLDYIVYNQPIPTDITNTLIGQINQLDFMTKIEAYFDTEIVFSSDDSDESNVLQIFYYKYYTHWSSSGATYFKDIKFSIIKENTDQKYKLKVNIQEEDLPDDDQNDYDNVFFFKVLCSDSKWFRDRNDKYLGLPNVSVLDDFIANDLEPADVILWCASRRLKPAYSIVIEFEDTAINSDERYSKYFGNNNLLMNKLHGEYYETKSLEHKKLTHREKLDTKYPLLLYGHDMKLKTTSLRYLVIYPNNIPDKLLQRVEDYLYNEHSVLNINDRIVIENVYNFDPQYLDSQGHTRKFSDSFSRVIRYPRNPTTDFILLGSDDGFETYNFIFLSEYRNYAIYLSIPQYTKYKVIPKMNIHVEGLDTQLFLTSNEKTLDVTAILEKNKDYVCNIARIEPHGNRKYLVFDKTGLKQYHLNEGVQIFKSADILDEVAFVNNDKIQFALSDYTSLTFVLPITLIIDGADHKITSNTKDIKDILNPFANNSNTVVSNINIDSFSNIKIDFENKNITEITLPLENRTIINSTLPINIGSTTITVNSNTNSTIDKNNKTFNISRSLLTGVLLDDKSDAYKTKYLKLLQFKENTELKIESVATESVTVKVESPCTKNEYNILVPKYEWVPYDNSVSINDFISMLDEIDREYSEIGSSQYSEIKSGSFTYIDEFSFVFETIDGESTIETNVYFDSDYKIMINNQNLKYLFFVRSTRSNSWHAYGSSLYYNFDFHDVDTFVETYGYNTGKVLSVSYRSIIDQFFNQIGADFMKSNYVYNTQVKLPDLFDSDQTVFYSLAYSVAETDRKRRIFTHEDETKEPSAVGSGTNIIFGHWNKKIDPNSGYYIRNSWNNPTDTEKATWQLRSSEYIASVNDFVNGYVQLTGLTLSFNTEESITLDNLDLDHVDKSKFVLGGRIRVNKDKSEEYDEYSDWRIQYFVVYDGKFEEPSEILSILSSV